MDIISELNLRSCMTCFQGAGKSEDIIPANLQDHFRSRIKLLKLENLRDRGIAAACPSGVQTMINARVFARETAGKTRILKAKMLPGKKQKPENKPEGFYWKKNTENLTA